MHSITKTTPSSTRDITIRTTSLSPPSLVSSSEPETGSARSLHTSPRSDEGPATKCPATALNSRRMSWLFGAFRMFVRFSGRKAGAPTARRTRSSA